ncbi:phosphonate C-P lyase system protein PhnH [Leptothrix discophora]|uniref:Phosphonate C-P lyase system protein PhnH n=1 Tax=Leptothrix discophora TaxID=89 RepID=A0ABT9G7D5_LEPDI|nr:phosphonate C-P lyase system protein PhnH [Leptothrix discophora]MDP4302088.1 phosphonate C-P lyase system protein PhnH [Leptothrix discophora]
MIHATLGDPAASTASLAAGLIDPVHGTQAVYRRVLDAMARPGRVARLPAGLFVHPSRPSLPLGSACAALLLTLCDSETTLWWSPGPRLPQLHAWARFHAGVRWVERVEDAEFVGLRGAALTPALWSRLRTGSDTAPQGSATLLVEVDLLKGLAADASDRDDAADAADGVDPLRDDVRLRLEGPGIETAHELRVAGIPRETWLARIAAQPDYPRGVDLLLCCGSRVVGLPRSTRLTCLED